MNDDLCYWRGNPINAMTREELQDALYAAKVIIENQRRELTMLKFILNSRFGKFKSDETIDSNRFTNDAYLASFC